MGGNKNNKVEVDKRSELLYEFCEKSSKLRGSVFSFNEISERLKEFKQNLTKNKHAWYVNTYVYSSGFWLFFYFTD